MTTPEKIYHWLDTQLSIARHYGGCNYNGRRYIIDIDDAYQPLVREDVYKKEAMQRKLDAKQTRADNAALQTSFFNDTSANNLAAVDNIIANATPSVVSGGGGDFGGGGSSGDYSSDSGGGGGGE